MGLRDRHDRRSCSAVRSLASDQAGSPDWLVLETPYDICDARLPINNYRSMCCSIIDSAELDSKKYLQVGLGRIVGLKAA